MKALWNGQVLAESKETIEVEGNQYFPPGSIDEKYFKDSRHTSTCPWKGEAHYYHLDVDGETNENAAWYYPEPKEAAKQIKNYVAFWKGVEVSED
jgi:uncharacterized protein (DUF427 family)